MLVANTAPMVCVPCGPPIAGREIDRLEGQHLPARGQLGLDLRQRRAGARRHDELVRLVQRDAAQGGGRDGHRPSTGRPMARLVPEPTISIGRRLSAHPAMTTAAPSRRRRRCTSLNCVSSSRLVRDRTLGRLRAHSSGKTLAGLSSQCGSNTLLMRICRARSAGENWTSHQVALLDADAVLAGQAAADRDAQLQDLGAGKLGPVRLVGVVGIVEDQRMQVAVAGVEDVGDLEAVRSADLRRSGPAPRAAAPSGMVPSMQ